MCIITINAGFHKGGSMKQLTTYLWVDNEAEEMAAFYQKVFKDNFRQGDTTSFLIDTPSNKPIGSVMTVEFELFGQKFSALNGGPDFKFNEAVSFEIPCDTQEEVDYYYESLSAVPESEICGWLKDKFGVSWQIVPKRFIEMLKSDNADGAKRAMQAMMSMKKLLLADLENAYQGK